MRFIGNKTQLLENIKEVIDKHVTNAYSFCDIFSGTASVGRFFKQWYEVYSNDLMYFSFCLQKGTVENSKKPDFVMLKQEFDINNPIKYFNNLPTEKMENLPIEKRFFQNNYSPYGNRMYLTDSNALRIDFVRNTIEDWYKNNLISEQEYFYLLSCLIEGIPYISNISGTYGAYNKTWDRRSYKLFELIELPIISNGKNNKSFNEDGTSLLKKISGDILYIDPPYNKRQYLPNYHILETAAKYDFPKLYGITGKRNYKNERSKFCSKKTALNTFEELMQNAKFEHIILSYNSEGIMPAEDIEQIMKKYGINKTYEINYIPYKRFKSNKSGYNNNDLKEMIFYIRKEV